MTVNFRAPHRIRTGDRNVCFGETVYDRVASALWALFFAFLLLCMTLICLWLHFVPLAAATSDVTRDSRQPGIEWVTETVPQEMVLADVDPVDVPEPSLDPAAEQYRSQENVSELLAVVSESAASSVESTMMPADSAEQGAEGESGVSFDSRIRQPPALLRQSWVIEITKPRSLSEYTRMLDCFAIEPGVAFPNGEISCLSSVSTSPRVRQISDPAAETRFYTVWSDGSLQELDRQLFESVGIRTSGGKLLQFYSPETERLLEQKSLDFAGRTPEQIRRTWFSLVRVPGGFDFEVTRQTAR